MDRVAESLFVGTIEDAGAEALLRTNGITRIISLTHASPDTGFPKFASVTRIPIIDGPRNDRERFGTAVEAVCSALESGDSVLVHCSRGASRSPSVAAAAHAIVRGSSIEQAFTQVAKHRDACDPHDTLVRQAVAVVREHNKSH